MARSAKKTSAKVSKRRWFLHPVVIALVFLAVLALGWNTYNHIQDQKRLEASMHQKGEELDKLARSLEGSGIAGKVERSKYCYEASRKFAKGPTYCVQRLDVTHDNASDQLTLDDFSTVAELVHEKTDLGFVTDDRIDTFRESGTIFAEYFPTHRTEYTNCRAAYKSKGSGWHKASSRGEYKIEITCLGGDFSRSIYEFQE